MTIISTIQRISDYSKGYSLLGAQIAGGVGLGSKLISVFLKEGGARNMTKNIASLGGYGFLAGASIFTGAYIADKLIDKYKNIKK